MDDPVMVATMLAVLSVSAAGGSIYLTVMRRRKQLLLSPLMDLRRLRR